MLTNASDFQLIKFNILIVKISPCKTGTVSIMDSVHLIIERCIIFVIYVLEL